ncbi:MAG: phage portal protein, partial [Dehalococcoidales bacterium]|nr:phage portal protein [Dehalococcoidales bacterium]
MILDRIMEKRDAKSIIAGILGGSSNSSAGVAVTADTAMRTSVVWACVRVLSTTMAALPLHVYKDRPGGGRDLAKDSPVYNLLHRSPNSEQTAYEFNQMRMAWSCLHGNAYAEIQFDQLGNPVALWPIPPWCCEPMRNQAKELFYRVTMPTGEQRNLQPYRVLHNKWITTGGDKALSPIRLHAESIGITLAADIFAGRFYGSGMNVGGIIEHPKQFSAQGSENFRKSLNEKYAGLGKSHQMMLLEEGAKYVKIGIPPNEAQFLESRQYQVEDLARIFGVQLHKIGHLLHATYSNIEHQGIEFVTDTMLPHAVNWEQEYDFKLLGNGLYTKHALEGLLRGDSASRAAFYRELFYLSSICPDEIREKEDWNPIPDGSGKRYYVQANMIPTDKVDAYLSNSAARNALPRPLVDETVRRIIERDKGNIT